ncbi:DUF397 domain-containing protein [Micromonospora sp. NBC_00362]|uniref:DUF397 domain-containing protein n=1 Tax=unclassified Micromonospora TaxID=2617518 RepID=UPI003390469A
MAAKGPHKEPVGPGATQRHSVPLGHGYDLPSVPEHDCCVRDSKALDVGTLRFAPAAWDAFVDTIKTKAGRP